MYRSNVVKLMVFNWGLLENESAVFFSLIFHNFVFVACFHLESDLEVAFCEWSLGFDYEMVVAMRTIFVGFFELFDLFTEDLFTFLASEDEFHCFLKLMVLSPEVFVAVWAIEPLLAALCTDCNLGVKDVFAHDDDVNTD